MAEAVDEESMRKFLAAYFKKKGFKQTENAFQDELDKNTNSSSSPISFNSKLGSDVAKHILSFSQYEEGPARYQDPYANLRLWTYSSLDLHRHELPRVLCPVFIHCFMDLVAEGHIQEARTFFNSFRENHKMMHQRDLQNLEGVSSPSHLEEMELAHSLRHSKANIKICQYSYDLLLQFLHKSQSATVLGIINEHINFQGKFFDQTCVKHADSFAVSRLSVQSYILLQLLEDSLEERLDKAGALDSEKAEGESKEGEGDEGSLL